MLCIYPYLNHPDPDAYFLLKPNLDPNQTQGLMTESETNYIWRNIFTLKDFFQICTILEPYNKITI